MTAAQALLIQSTLEALREITDAEAFVSRTAATSGDAYNVAKVATGADWAIDALNRFLVMAKVYGDADTSRFAEAALFPLADGADGVLRS